METLLKKYPEEIKVYNWRTKQAKDCDICFIGDSAESIIEKKKTELVNGGVKSGKIYSFIDLKNFLHI